MSLTSDLKRLQAAQQSEVLLLHRTYLRTKREMKREAREYKRKVQRTLSPGRMIRKHPGAALGIGALLGFLLAPSGRKASRAKVPREKKTASPGARNSMHRLARMAKRLIRKKAPVAPAPSPKEEEHSWPAILETTVAAILGTLKIDQIIGHWTRSIAESLKGRMSRHHEGNGRHHEETESMAGPEPMPGPKRPGLQRFDFEQQ